MAAADMPEAPPKGALMPVNETGMMLGWVPGRARFPKFSLSLIVKGTFDLRPGEAASLAEEPLELCGDEFFDEDPEASLRYDSDFAYFKPRTDLSLVGNCHVPGGQERPACRVVFQVGQVARTLAVFGDRYWSKTSDGRWQSSQPRPFSTMELRYENAFGGAGFERNPVGKGRGVVTTDDGKRWWPLPNIMDPRSSLASPEQVFEPAGFGPLASGWPQRASKVGTYDDAWLEKRWPWFAEDFDWGYMNAAPPPLQKPDYLNGDEELFFENLHPTIPEYRSRLPGLRARCFLNRREEPGQEGPRFREVPLRLDTLWVDMAAERLVLVWRGVADVDSEDYAELGHAFVLSERLEEAPRTLEAAYQDFLAVLAGEEEDEPPVPTVEPVDVEAEVAAAEAEVRLEMIKAGLDPKDLEDERSSETLIAKARAGLAKAYSDAGLDPAEAEKWEPPKDESDQLLKEFLEAQGLNLSDYETPVPLDLAGCLARIAQGESCAGEDLSGFDLSGRDLKGANFEGAILTGAKLVGADLSSAVLNGAVLAEADLSQAKLGGAQLQQADLTKAKLPQADLTGAVLDGATCDGGDFRSALLVGAGAVGAEFVGADFSNANLQGCNLESADLSRSVLQGADLRQANLRSATLEEANGARVNMDGATLVETNASGGCSFVEGSFVMADGSDSIWEEADLRGANFSGAQLGMANFEGACLEGAAFVRCDMPEARFIKANLRAARMAQSNLFQGSLEKANLESADLRATSFYEVEFRDAILKGARLDHANLRMTKLERP
jgi:uncharacterized protein YjbI with pentapeptide repeats